MFGIYLTTVDRAIVSIYRLLNDISFTVHLQTSMVVQNSDISRDKWKWVWEEKSRRDPQGGGGGGTETCDIFLRSAAGMMRNERAKNSDSRKLLT